MREEFLRDVDGTVDLQIQRLKNSDTLMLVREVRLDDRRNLGILTREPIHYTVKANSLSDAVQKGTRSIFQLLRSQFAAFLGKFKSEKRVSGGPINVSAAFGDDRYWEFFWYRRYNEKEIFLRAVQRFAEVGVVYFLGDSAIYIHYGFEKAVLNKCT